MFFYKSILFPITYECNLSCALCCVKNCKQLVNIQESLKYLQNNKLSEWVYITGGEPFLITQLESICDSLKEYGYKVGITTNGTFFRPEIAEHVDRFGISLDGCQEYHDFYRGQGVFEKALFLLNSVKNRCETVIMSTVFKENIEHLRKLKPIIEEINPTYWQIQRDINDSNLVIPEDL